jgi:hypothetical protein
MRDEGHCGLTLSLMRLDADDVLASTALERLHAAVRAHSACLSRLSCAVLSGSHALVQITLGLTSDGAPRCHAVSREGSEFWSLGQTVSLPWLMWRRLYPEGAATFGAHHTLVAHLRARLAPHRVSLEV